MLTAPFVQVSVLFDECIQCFSGHDFDAIERILRQSIILCARPSKSGRKITRNVEIARMFDYLLNCLHRREKTHHCPAGLWWLASRALNVYFSQYRNQLYLRMRKWANLVFHCNNLTRQAVLNAELPGWVAIGFSSNGFMVGSDAVVAIPSQGIATEYDLDSRVSDFCKASKYQHHHVVLDSICVAWREFS